MHSMDILNRLLSSTWFVALLGAAGVTYFGALLWKILKADEGFLFGYGNWVVGKWQAVQNSVRQSSGDGRKAEQAPKEPQRKKDGKHPHQPLKVKDNVLTLSRLLDGDLAFLMMNDSSEWETKVLRALQTLVSGVTRVVYPAGRCRCGFFILDDEEQHLVMVAGEGYIGSARPKLALEHSCAGRAFLTGEDYYCRDSATDPVYWHSARGNRDFRSIACVPVRAGRAVFGVICLDAAEPEAFKPDDFLYLEVFAAKLAVFCAFHTLQVEGMCHVRTEEGS